LQSCFLENRNGESPITWKNIYLKPKFNMHSKTLIDILIKLKKKSKYTLLFFKVLLRFSCKCNKDLN
jgi:hypothetical protein